MMRRFLFIASLAAVLLLGMSTRANSSALQAQGQSERQQQQQAGSITGKVASVSGSSFSIEVGEGDTKRTMEFTTNADTTLSGQLKVGSTATVQYRSAGGQNIATRVEVRG